MTHVLVARLVTHELLGHEAVLCVDARIQLERQLDERIDVAVSVHVFADEAGAVGQAVWKLGRL